MVEPDSERIFPFHFGGAFIEAWSEKWCRFGTAAFPFLFGRAFIEACAILAMAPSAV